MTKRVIVGAVILLVAVAFSVFSERYIGRTAEILGERLASGDGGGFAEEYSGRKSVLQFLLSDSSVGDLDSAARKLLAEDEKTRTEGEEEAEKILFRIREEEAFSLAKIF